MFFLPQRIKRFVDPLYHRFAASLIPIKASTSGQPNNVSNEKRTNNE